MYEDYIHILMRTPLGDNQVVLLPIKIFNKMIKSVKKEISMDILEEVLRKHLKSHIVVARDQLTDKDKMTIFKEFDEAIEKQLFKLEGKDGEELSTEIQGHDSIGRVPHSGDDSKPSEPQTSRFRIKAYDDWTKYTKEELRKLHREKEPTEVAGSARQTELQEPFDLRKFIIFALENAKVELPNKEQINKYVLVSKAELEKWFKWMEEPYFDDEMINERNKDKEKYLKEDKLK